MGHYRQVFLPLHSYLRERRGSGRSIRCRKAQDALYVEGMGFPVRLLWLCGAILFVVGPLCAGELVVRVPAPESLRDTRDDFFVEALTLALEATRGTDGPFRVEFSKIDMPVQGRGIRYLKERRYIDIIWTMTSIQREKELLPIRVPLLKGLLGYRLLLIDKRDAKKFEAVKTLEDLRAFTAGQGQGWPDVGILRANGIRVVIGRTYDGLFEMLRRGRFDFFPRGVTEAWGELAVRGELGLMAEPHLALHYPTAIYFFVSRRDELLADRIERGLWAAIKSGAYEKLFLRHFGHVLEQADLQSRHFIQLKNPLLPQSTPVDRSEIWYQEARSERQD